MGPRAPKLGQVMTMDVNVDPELVNAIVNVVLAVLAVYFGGKFRALTKGLKLTREKLQQAQDLIGDIEEAIEDEEISPEEAKKLFNDLRELLSSE